MQYYSDLATECRELSPDCRDLDEELEEIEGVSVKTLKIETDEQAAKIGREKGTYITLEIGDIDLVNAFSVAKAIKQKLVPLIPEKSETVLVAGLGNRNITPDAIGPRTVSKIIATRHISKSLAERIGLLELKSVAVIAPGVLGQTGIETAEIVSALARVVSASAVIVIDALTAASVTRLLNTLQITDSEIHPGSGVGNKRGEISKRTLGVPCIAIGVPTVVNAATLITEATGTEGKAPEMIVTPKDIDGITDSLSHIIALGINIALQPDMSPAEIQSIM